MRIGILTLPLHTNYGGILQAYALQTTLERMGHKVFLIEKRREPLKLPLWKAPLSYGKRIFKNIIGHPFPVFYEQKVNREMPIVRQYTDKFIDKLVGFIIQELNIVFDNNLYEAFALHINTLINRIKSNNVISNSNLDKIKTLYPDSMMSGSGSSYFLINGEFQPLEGYLVKNGFKSVPDGVKII